MLCPESVHCVANEHRSLKDRENWLQSLSLESRYELGCLRKINFRSSGIGDRFSADIALPVQLTFFKAIFTFLNRPYAFGR